ncbi:hypothetical protein [Aureimonas sp. AU12]|uniref:hypothetical protein n=1 Tax=Aureimonas sp. AU12 TaxID=1638161 RepID=UPI000785A9BC|nr:hypothetical protein [Aureimonas sp. AU12]
MFAICVAAIGWVCGQGSGSAGSILAASLLVVGVESVALAQAGAGLGATLAILALSLIALQGAFLAALLLRKTPQGGAVRRSEG